MLVQNMEIIQVTSREPFQCQPDSTPVGAVYDVVLKILEESMQLLTPEHKKEYNMEVGKLMTSALIDLGL